MAALYKLQLLWGESLILRLFLGQMIFLLIIRQPLQFLEDWCPYYGHQHLSVNPNKQIRLDMQNNLTRFIISPPNIKFSSVTFCDISFAIYLYNETYNDIDEFL